LSVLPKSFVLVNLSEKREQGMLGLGNSEGADTNISWPDFGGTALILIPAESRVFCYNFAS